MVDLPKAKFQHGRCRVMSRRRVTLHTIRLPCSMTRQKEHHVGALNTNLPYGKLSVFTLKSHEKSERIMVVAQTGHLSA